MSKSLQGFRPLSICFSGESTSNHTMFMKEHSIRNQSDDKPVNRTLYLINVPPWATEASLSLAFRQYALVSSTTFAKLKDTVKSGFKAAFIVFETEKDLQKALKIDRLPAVSTTTAPILIGIDKWVKEYNQALTGQLDLEQTMTQTIKNYDARVNEANQKAAETDEEGWTLVTKKGRKPGLSRKESVHDKLLAKNKKDKVLKNFYRHQIRQAKREQLATLRKRAEEDKKKILALKQRRAFMPF